MRSRILRTAILSITLAALGATPVAAQARADTPRLTDPHPCPDQPGFTCSTLTVPLDHDGVLPGRLDLQVATADNADAPKGVLLFLAGGPGAAGVPFTSFLAGNRMPEIAKNYRFVMFDQRGTGANAVDCPRLQSEVGTSDIAVPTPQAVRECAAGLGENRRLYSTEQSLADFDLLRRALGQDKITVDGASYGAFTAARYAAAFPGHVKKVVLDSVVPHVASADVPLYLVGLRAQARVLRTACGRVAGCDWDPASDLDRLVRDRRYDSVKIFDMIVGYEFADRNYTAVIRALHDAAGGDTAGLDELLAGVPGRNAEHFQSFSSGLHAATFCTDARFPWGDSATSPDARPAALRRATERLSRHQVWPYTPETAAGNGFVQTCLAWPATRPGANATKIPANVPVLILGGDQDLSTPLEWAFEEARLAPRHKIVIVPGAAHLIQALEPGTTGRRAVSDFLN